MVVEVGKKRARKKATVKTGKPAAAKKRPGRRGKNAEYGVPIVKTPAKTANGHGAPRIDLTEEAIEQLEDLLLEGRSYEAALLELGIKHRTFYRRTLEDPALKRRMQQAREFGMQLQIDGISELEQRAVDRDSAAALTARVNARKVRATLLAPLLYGPSLTHKGDNDNPIRVGVVVVPAKAVPDNAPQMRTINAEPAVGTVALPAKQPATIEDGSGD